MNTITEILRNHTHTLAVPEIPELVRVPHTMMASQSKRYAALALNSCAKLAALHALHVAAINEEDCFDTVQRALCDSYVQIERAMREEYSMAMRHGGLLYAWHGTKAFDVPPA